MTHDEQKPQELRLKWENGESRIDVFYLWVAHEPHIDKDGKWRWCLQVENTIEALESQGYYFIKECFGRRDDEISAKLAAESALESIYLSLREKFGATNDYKKKGNYILDSPK